MEITKPLKFLPEGSGKQKEAELQLYAVLRGGDVDAQVLHECGGFGFSRLSSLGAEHLHLIAKRCL